MRPAGAPGLAMTDERGAESSAARGPAQGAWSSAAGAGHARTIAGRARSWGRRVIASAIDASQAPRTRLSLALQSHDNCAERHAPQGAPLRPRCRGPPGLARARRSRQRSPPPADLRQPRIAAVRASCAREGSGSVSLPRGPRPSTRARRAGGRREVKSARAEKTGQREGTQNEGKADAENRGSPCRLCVRNRPGALSK